jgi:formylmethanofuran dehydrogenase subunit D
MNSSFDSYYVENPMLNQGNQNTPTNTGDQVKVKGRDGSIILIPKANLGKALEAGYTQVN